MQHSLHVQVIINQMKGAKLLQMQIIENLHKAKTISGLESQSISALNQNNKGGKILFCSETLHLKSILSFLMCSFSSLFLYWGHRVRLG